MSNVIVTPSVPRTYIITVPVSTVYRTDKNGEDLIVQEKPKGSLFEMSAFGQKKTPNGTISIIIGKTGNWINKSDATLYVKTEISEKLLENQKILENQQNSTAITSNTSSNQPVPKKSYKNIILGVMAIGLVFGLLKWKKVI